MKTRYTLEYMALCGDPTLSPDEAQRAGLHPAPPGVPTGIAGMPDFVIDTSADMAPEQPRQTPAPYETRAVDVGGRARRLAWLLQRLALDLNGLFHVGYITEAGPPERHLLADHIGPTGARYVFPAPSDRLAIYKGPGAKCRPEAGKPVTSVQAPKPQVNHRLAANRLGRAPEPALSGRARLALCVASEG